MREVPFLLERSAVSLGEKYRFSMREVPLLSDRSGTNLSSTG